MKFIVWYLQLINRIFLKIHSLKYVLSSENIWSCITKSSAIPHSIYIFGKHCKSSINYTKIQNAYAFQLTYKHCQVPCLAESRISV